MVKVSSWFVTKAGALAERSFTSLREDAPEWLRDAVYKAHDGRFPDDWIYAECLAAAHAIDDESLTEDSLHEHADSQVDIYTKDRFQWAANFCLSDIYGEAEEQAAELWSAEQSIVDRIGVIQFCAIERIAGIILAAVTENTSNES